jgi:RimJ/RimL family protein N-acetyltransferase
MSTSRVRLHQRTKDGRSFIIREAERSDATQLIAHAQSILREPDWNITEPYEFKMTVAQEEAWIHDSRAKPHGIILVADIGGLFRPQIIGMVSFSGHTRFRMRHRGGLGIGVQAPYRGQGIGEALLRALLDWAAQEPELERVELAVFAHNERALNLYRKLGFEEENRRLGAFKLADGSYYDEIQMVRWVKQPTTRS